MNKKYRIARNKHGEVIAVYLKFGKWYLDYGENGNYEYEITPYTEDELTFLDEEEEKNLTYWDKLLHQYAGMAMQGIIVNISKPYFDESKITSIAIRVAKEMIEHLKD